MVLSVLPLTIFSVSNMLYYNGKLESLLENDLRNTVSTQMKAIENFYEERQTDAAVILGYQIMDDLLWAGAGGGQLRDIAEDLLRSRVESNQYVESVTLLDKNFVVVACSDGTAHGQESTLRDIDPRYLTDRLLFTNVVETQRTGRRHKVIAAVQAVTGREGGTAGYLVMEINMRFFEELRVSANVYNNGTVYLLDGAGQMIAAGDSQSSRSQFLLSDAEQGDFRRAWEARDKGESTGVLHYTAQGARYMSCYTKFTHMEWLLLSSVNIDEVLGTRKRATDLVLLIALVLAVLLIAVSVIISRSLARPMSVMIDRFRLIRLTQDYSLRMPPVSGSEIGTITEEVNALLSSMENYIQLERREQEKLREKAQRDPLTGLFNKEATQQLLRLELERARVEHRQLALLFVDVDDFKHFNTQYGHLGGDKVLCFIAGCLSSCSGGLAGRQGGDEFLACLADVPSQAALEGTLQKLLRRLNAGVVLEEGGAPVPVRCSIGAALSQEGLQFEGLLERADTAMYTVKQREKNGVALWRWEMGAKVAVGK